MKKIITLILVILSIATLSICPTQAQKKKGKKQEETKKDTKTISELINGHQKLAGLFEFYQDTVSGETKMLIKTDQIGEEFIHWYYIENGEVSVSTFRGEFLDSKIIKINKHFNKIEIVSLNTSFYFDPNNALSKSQDANISQSILFSGEILGGNEKEGGYLIKSDPLFLKEILGIVDFTQFREEPKSFKLGTLSDSKTKIQSIKNYPDNTDVIVEYVFENKKTNLNTSNALADSRNISIKVQHSLLKIPDNTYTPRYDDPRVGYFTTKVDDMTSTDAITYRDLIHRWDLQKSDSTMSVSKPVTPITWWIENSTPMEFRETIKEAVLEWNKAFEAAGFKDAIVVKIQPDDAQWDAGDINYNVLRWTSSPEPPFGGYGPSFVNPRTGQILGADIMLEYVYHTNRVKYSKLYEQDIPNGHMICSAGHHFQTNTMFGLSTLKATGASDLEMEGLKREAMKELVMHEVGHTLGLNHNMKASQRFTPDELANKELIKNQCLTGSVMDYTAINLTKDRAKQGQYYSTTVGPYDIWAITYGYHYDGSPTSLDQILGRSTEPDLIFGNDADDMRAPGVGIDPRVMVGDLSNDVIGYAINSIEISMTTMGLLKEKFSTPGESYEELKQNFGILMRAQSNMCANISRFIGGVYVDRSMAGQKKAAKPYTPVAAAEQKRALNALNKYAFSPDAFSAPNELYNYLATQRRGFNLYGTTEDPKIQEDILNIQKGILNQIMHKNTLQRLSDSYLYGNTYSLSSYMNDLNQIMFGIEKNNSINTTRQNLQIEYTKRLINIVDDKSDYISAAKSMALYNLQSIRKMTMNSTDLSTLAHKRYLDFMISQSLDK
ncbi:zinc-dependent metalloprotease [Reichenbachiella agarivorans]|uniref:Zinc-dependent metalloprotease n=1 Tax=Reichenbachiella agarivorans TaxID=2979464 RepID=A0ABY6CQS7_9BACT|nr:zinc-dependent metalloprotease [Reichenbachiella agarivorans]UXP32866.1 zinc-dependent metalloprotease [Reichenbachiella agarivorans]